MDREKVVAFRGDREGLQSLGVETAVILELHYFITEFKILYSIIYTEKK